MQCQLNQKFRARKVSAGSERMAKGAGRFLQPRPLSRAETFSHTAQKYLSKTRLDSRQVMLHSLGYGLCGLFDLSIFLCVCIYYMHRAWANIYVHRAWANVYVHRAWANVYVHRAWANVYVHRALANVYVHRAIRLYTRFIPSANR